MNHIEELNTINDIFIGFAGGITVRHENEKHEGLEEWIRVTYQTASADQISLGSNPRYRYEGVLYVQIFVEPDIGTGRSTELVDMVTALLRSNTINGITFKVPKAFKVGVVNGWYQVNVVTNFYRES